MKVMIIDDDMELLRNLAAVLNKMGCEVCVHGEPGQAISAYRDGGADLVLTDLKMPGINGLEVLRRIRAIDPSARVALVTGCPGGSWETLAEREGVFRILGKPLNLSDLNALLSEVRSVRRMDDTISPVVTSRGVEKEDVDHL